MRELIMEAAVADLADKDAVEEGAQVFERERQPPLGPEPPHADAHVRREHAEPEALRRSPRVVGVFRQPDARVEPADDLVHDRPRHHGAARGVRVKALREEEQKVRKKVEEPVNGILAPGPDIRRCGINALCAQGLQAFLQEIRRERHIGVEEVEIFALREGSSAVPRRRHPVLEMPLKLEALELPPVAHRHFLSSVIAVAVGDDDLEVLVGLLRERLQQPRKIELLVQRDDDDADHSRMPGLCL